MKVGLDAYTLNARLMPALLAVAPVAWTVMAWSADHAVGWGGLWALLVAVGGTALLSQLARDRGKRKERELFDAHGGLPTERLLSHAHAPSKVALAQRHAKLRLLLPGVAIPSEADEMRDPSAANEVYEACVGQVISRTSEDRLLLQENINYGFRRNFWGLKPVGLAVSLGSVVILGLRLFLEFSSRSHVSPLVLSSWALSVTMLLIWLTAVKPSWVMLAARAYAERLFAALDRLVVV